MQLYKHNFKKRFSLIHIYSLCENISLFSLCDMYQKKDDFISDPWFKSKF